MMTLFTFLEAQRAADSAADAAGQARRARSDAMDTEMRMDRVVLAFEALWTLLRDKVGLTEDDLAVRMNEIDLSDGKLDGKVRKSAVSCPKCCRTISRRLAKCIYCGQAIVHDPFA
jgi:hypothetical protein